MNVVTYNLRHGGARRVHWSRVITEFRPDLLLVQESLPPREHLPDANRAELRRRVVWSPATGRAWGCGVLAGSGSVRRLPPGDFVGWLTGAEVRLAAGWPATGRRLKVFSLHTPPPKVKGLSYVRTVHAMLDCVARHRRGADLIVGGDFNISISERHPSEGRRVSRADREFQLRLRDEFGLMNCWQAANPGEPLAQTLRWSNDPTCPYHCDGIFVPAAWRDRLTGCRVIASGEWDGLSDHNPVVASFAPRPIRRRASSAEPEAVTTPCRPADSRDPPRAAATAVPRQVRVK